MNRLAKIRFRKVCNLGYKDLVKNRLTEKEEQTSNFNNLDDLYAEYIKMFGSFPVTDNKITTDFIITSDSTYYK